MNFVRSLMESALILHLICSFSIVLCHITLIYHLRFGTFKESSSFEFSLTNGDIRRLFESTKMCKKDYFLVDACEYSKSKFMKNPEPCGKFDNGRGVVGGGSKMAKKA